MRYYRGVIPTIIIKQGDKKALVMYLGYGRVGSKQLGFKNVKPFDVDVTLIRFCYRNRKEGKDLGER